MAKPRRLTFAKGTIGRFVRKHRLFMEPIEVPAFSICRKDEYKGQKHYLLLFQRPGGKSWRIGHSQTRGDKGSPEIEDVLEGLASDILLLEQYQTPEALCHGLGIPEDECEEVFERLSIRRQDMIEFLGAEAYDELGELTIQNKFEMEGVAWWQRTYRTCGE